MAKQTFLVDIDLAKNQLLNPVFQNLGTDPLTPSTGQFFYSSAISKPKFFNGTA